MVSPRAAALAGLVGLAVAALGPFARATPRPAPAPPPVDDRDAIDEARSTLWEGALDPARGPYHDKVLEARRLVDARNPDVVTRGVALLTEAIALRPADPEAYALRGDGELQLGRWAACAADHQAALDRRPPPGAMVDPAVAVARRRALAVCLARAGRLSEAEGLLADLAAGGARDGELWLRLGETRIALGKLDEAIAALAAGLEVTPSPAQAPLEWLLAAAYDRAREPALAAEHARAAALRDRGMSALASPGLPLLGEAEADYLFGLGWLLAEPANPESALVYFHRFVRLAPKSPWRARAEEHLAELARTPLPGTILRRAGNAPLPAEPARAAIRAAMPRLRACLAATPGLVLEVALTRVGPRTVDTARDRPRAWTPPPGSALTPQLNLDDLPRDRVEALLGCVQPLADAITLPPITERDTWYRAVFTVVGS